MICSRGHHSSLKATCVTVSRSLSNDLSDRWGNFMWPSVYLVDKRGYIRFWWYGELNWNGAGGQEIMKQPIRELVKEDGRPVSCGRAARGSDTPQLHIWSHIFGFPLGKTACFVCRGHVATSHGMLGLATCERQPSHADTDTGNEGECHGSGPWHHRNVVLFCSAGVNTPCAVPSLRTMKV